MDAILAHIRPGRATEDTKRCSLTDARIAQPKRIVFREETTKHIFTCNETPFSSDPGRMHRPRDRGPTIRPSKATTEKDLKIISLEENIVLIAALY